MFTFRDLYTITHPITCSFKTPSWYKALELHLNPDQDRRISSSNNFRYKYCYGYSIIRPTYSQHTSEFAVGWLSQVNYFVLGRIIRIDQDTVHLLHHIPSIGPNSITILNPYVRCQIHQESAIKFRGHYDNCYFTLPLFLCAKIPISSKINCIDRTRSVLSNDALYELALTCFLENNN